MGVRESEMPRCPPFGLNLTAAEGYVTEAKEMPRPDVF